ncbi:uncharacterized protein LOC123011435 [Tribolium madens]|uniref:uncharacterized protein LOC123011435 n=1 Tax=Tribolium madens TaxID=41895 RepID=UPI001CF75BCB|nr:uncharacterized protein LOC123011435 [Tribolium madens]
MKNYKLSKQDINFIRPLWRYLNIFLIIPWYDFNKNCVYKPFLMKLSGCVLIVGTIFWSIVPTFDETIRQMYYVMPFSEKCVYILTLVNLKLFVFLVVIKCCFLDVEKWVILMTSFQFIDEKLNNAGKKEEKILKNFYFRFCLKQFFFILFAFYITYIWSLVLDYPFIKSFLTGLLLELFYEYQVIILIRCVVISIKIRYKDLNKKLRELHSSQNVISDLQNLVEYFRILGEMIDLLNDLFGYQIILFLFHSGLQVVGCVSFMFSMVKQTQESMFLHFIIANVSVLIFTIINLFAIILPIDATMQESKKFIQLCFRTQEYYFIQNAQKAKELSRLTRISKHYVREFSLAGFCNISKSIIFCFIGNVATYVIITLQFNEANIENRYKM